MPTDQRPEGVYCEWIVYPPEGGPYSGPLLVIERVNGDCSVSQIVLTSAEAQQLKAKI